MEIRRVTALWFSPTGGTEAVTRAVGAQLAECLRVPLQTVDWTLPAARRKPLAFGPADVLAVGLPTYAGKLPNKLLPDLRSALSGTDTPAAALVTFGNRSFDNALAELVSLLSDRGFLPAAGAALVCRHAFTDRLAPGRPDPHDLAEARAFADRTADILREGIPGAVCVPGDADAPYYVPKGADGQPVQFLKAKPVTDPDRCVRCGQCAARCPMGSISAEDPAQVPGICIKCHACVRGCPAGAKSFADPAFLSHVRMLEATCTAHRNNAFFYAVR